MLSNSGRATFCYNTQSFVTKCIPTWWERVDWSDWFRVLRRSLWSCWHRTHDRTVCRWYHCRRAVLDTLYNSQWQHSGLTKFTLLGWEAYHKIPCIIVFYTSIPWKLKLCIIHECNRPTTFMHLSIIQVSMGNMCSKQNILFPQLRMMLRVHIILRKLQ